MKYFLISLAFSLKLMAYDFILLNNTDIDDETITEAIEEQFSNYYYKEDNEISFVELENKEEILELMASYDFSSDDDALEELIQENEELEEDLRNIYDTKYLLLVSEIIDREGRTELQISLKVDRNDYLDENYIMPTIEDKDVHYADTIVSVVLTYISYIDKEFIKVYQL